MCHCRLSSPTTLHLQIAFFLLGFGGWAGDIFAQTSKVSNDKEHFAGVAEAHRANLESWQTGDLLLRVQIDGDGQLYERDKGVVEGPDAETLLTHSFRIFRVVFDFTNGRFLIVRRGAGKAEAFDSLDEPIIIEGVYPIQNQSIRLVLVDPTQSIALVKVKPGVVSEFKAMNSFEKQAQLSGVPMIPGFGILSVGHWDLKGLLADYERITNPDQIDRVDHVGKNTYRVTCERETRSGFRYAVQTDWDIVNFVPRRTIISSVLEGGGYSAKPREEEFVQWKEVNSAMVPISFRRSSSHILPHDIKTFRQKTVQQVDLHWFSLNEPLDPELFDPSNLTDASKMDKLLDTSVFEDRPAEQDQDR